MKITITPRGLATTPPTDPSDMHPAIPIFQQIYQSQVTSNKLPKSSFIQKKKPTKTTNLPFSCSLRLTESCVIPSTRTCTVHHTAHGTREKITSLLATCNLSVHLLLQFTSSTCAINSEQCPTCGMFIEKVWDCILMLIPTPIRRISLSSPQP